MPYFNITMPNSIYAAFNRVSINTWLRIQQGHNVDYLLTEETLTQQLIFELKSYRLPGFHIQAFTKIAESENGADWGWWFKDIFGKWIGMRVQAKVIYKDGKVFRELHRKISKLKDELGSPVYQCDVFIDQARDEEPRRPRIPIYCLYSYWTKPPRPVPFGLGSWSPQLGEESFGCSIISARKVQQLRGRKPERKKCQVADTLPHSFPLANLVCNGLNSTEKSIVEIALVILDEAGALDSDAATYRLDSPPNYVRNLMEGRMEKFLPNESEVLPRIPTDDLIGDLGGVLIMSQLLP